MSWLFLIVFLHWYLSICIWGITGLGAEFLSLSCWVGILFSLSFLFPWIFRDCDASVLPAVLTSGNASWCQKLGWIYKSMEGRMGGVDKWDPQQTWMKDEPVHCYSNAKFGRSHRDLFFCTSRVILLSFLKFDYLAFCC